MIIIKDLSRSYKLFVKEILSSKEDEEDSTLTSKSPLRVHIIIQHINTEEHGGEGEDKEIKEWENSTENDQTFICSEVVETPV